MYLLALQFPIPSEKKRSDTDEKFEGALEDIFGKTDISHFECSERMPSLCRLYASQSLTKFEAMELIRFSVIEILHNCCGMGTYMFQNIENKEIFCRIRCPDDILLEEAHLYKDNFQMNPDLEESSDVKLIMPYIPFNKQKYEKNPELYAKHGKGILKNIDRIRIMERLIQAHINIEMMIKNGFLIDFFPIHEESSLDSIEESLLESNQLIDLRMPILTIKDYFGDKLAFYYIWLQFFTNRLFILSYSGLAFCIIGYYIADINQISLLHKWTEIIFGATLFLWIISFIVYWGRESQFYALQFGAQYYKENDLVRQNVDHKTNRNSILIQFQNLLSAKAMRQVFSNFINLFVIGWILLLSNSNLFYWKIFENNYGENSYIFASILNALQIVFMQKIYDYVAFKLTNYEDHKLQSEFENSLIMKRVVYQLVNYFSRLIYLAFIKEHFEICYHNNCTDDLSLNLWIFYIVYIIFNISQVILKLLGANARYKAEDSKIKIQYNKGEIPRMEISHLEAEGKFSKIDLIDEYLPLAMNYGFIVLFCIAFPLGPLIFWLYNVALLKLNSYKIIYYSKRPMPEVSGGIGIWNDIIKFLSYAGLITNIGLLVLRDNIFNFNYHYRWWNFITLEHLMLGLMIFILASYPLKSDFMKDIENKQNSLIKKFYSKSYSKPIYEPRYTVDQSINMKDC
ncbi:unnamed protein product [Blepharisma stoltei]|uniref:Anoctamin transmembrane domain-containing protein n=1 Tax=Blepharisma stoltei TaxID=1481888 RepID=A0AAU9JD52_9CILI|nr:unnamed protein product [Blepharisma stoltei]